MLAISLRWEFELVGSRLYLTTSGSGEIGRRTALRWLRPQGHEGSSPPFRTTEFIVQTGHMGNSSFLKHRWHLVPKGLSSGCRLSVDLSMPLDESRGKIKASGMNRIRPMAATGDGASPAGSNLGILSLLLRSDLYQTARSHLTRISIPG
jgi:hypothetical protein